ncbi:phosphonoacetaldehyde reductase [Streptomyces noursei]|uniref:phosphonoacetaldehyde reductase n=1 Tax=Streptomyces noursei TaxID=1971 RepID=UPI00331FA425
MTAPAAPSAPAPAPALEVVIGRGRLSHLDRLLGDRWAARRVLVVASERGLERHRVLDRLAGFRTETFTGFAPNPTLAQALAGCAVRDAFQPDAVVAVGGGSALDTAKLVRSLPTGADAALRCLDGATRDLRTPRVPLLAVPTTAGTGSEVTRFATVFAPDGRKRSLDGPEVRPDAAIVDPLLLRGCPPAVRYACAFDAFCHAVESYWSRRSTPRSRQLAGAALRDLAALLARGLDAPGDDDSARLAAAAHRAGLAIDLTRTTAAHAFAYRLTTRFGVPHGVACLLNLRWLWEYNERHLATHCHDARGADHVARTLGELRTLVEPLARRREPAEFLRAALEAAGRPPELRGYGVGPEDLAGLIAHGRCPGRADNNPVALDERLVGAALAAVR